MPLIKTKNFQLTTYSQGHPDSSKLAMVLPGKLDTKDYAHMISHVDSLAGLGYYALSFDPPGTWESPGDISLYTMTNWLHAINELIDFHGNKPTFLIGHSRGGSMAMLAGLRNPHVTHFASIMSNPSFTDYTPDPQWQSQGYKTHLRDLPPGNQQPTKKFLLPYSFAQDASQYNLTEELKQSTKPKLFIYGAKDTTVEPEIIKSTFKIASEPKELHELNSDHDYRYHPHLIDQVNQVVKEFLQKYQF